VPNAGGIPLGRQGHVDEIAATCLFLVSEDGAVRSVICVSNRRRRH